MSEPDPFYPETYRQWLDLTRIALASQLGAAEDLIEDITWYERRVTRDLQCLDDADYPESTKRAVDHGLAQLQALREQVAQRLIARAAADAPTLSISPAHSRQPSQPASEQVQT